MGLCYCCVCSRIVVVAFSNASLGCIGAEMAFWVLCVCTGDSAFESESIFIHYSEVLVNGCPVHSPFFSAGVVHVTGIVEIINTAQIPETATEPICDLNLMLLFVSAWFWLVYMGQRVRMQPENKYSEMNDWIKKSYTKLNIQNKYNVLYINYLLTLSLAGIPKVFDKCIFWHH